MAVFPKERELRIVELQAPKSRGERDVTVRVREVGICGTDREICGFHYGKPPLGEERLVLGHEALGEVVDVGPAVHALHRGDLVAMMVRRPCEDGACVACRAGRQDFCITVRQLEQFMVLFPDAVRGLITERANLQDAPALLRRPGGIKQVVTMA